MTDRAPGTLSVQLFSVRKALAQDQPAALTRLAEIGLRFVEPFGLCAADGEDAFASLRAAERLRRDLDTAGVRASSAHSTFPRDLSQLVEELGTIGADHVFLPVPAAAPDSGWEAFSQRETLDRLADYLGAAAEELAGHGITVGYHNHWWEWNDLDGQVAYERFLTGCGERVGVELDAYWSLQGGQDPAELAATLGERVKALHLKSGPARRGELTLDAAMALDQRPLADGALEVRRLLEATDAPWHVLEVDYSSTDVFELLAANARTCLEIGRSTF